MTVDVKLMTAEELAAMPDDGRRYELVNGELVEIAPSFGRHGVVAGRIVRSLARVTALDELGELVVADAGYVLHRGPDTVRCPDVSFLRNDRTAEDAFIDGAPDVVFEVVSSSDTYTKVNAKVRDYLRGGSRMVAVVDPRTDTVVVHTPNGVQRLTIDDVIDGGDLLPGWRLPLCDLFK